MTIIIMSLGILGILPTGSTAIDQLRALCYATRCLQRVLRVGYVCYEFRKRTNEQNPRLSIVPFALRMVHQPYLQKLHKEVLIILL